MPPCDLTRPRHASCVYGTSTSNDAVSISLKPVVARSFRLSGCNPDPARRRLGLCRPIRSSVASTTLPGNEIQSKWAMTIRPPVRNTRRASAAAFALSNQCQHCPAVTTSNERSPSGIASARPSKYVTSWIAAWRSNRRACARSSGDGSSAVTVQPRRARPRARVPVPVPRSSTRSPGRIRPDLIVRSKNSSGNPAR